MSIRRLSLMGHSLCFHGTIELPEIGIVGGTLLSRATVSLLTH